METIIKLTDINKVYRTEEIETQALENVNIEVEKGEFLSVMGPSGCGKSTLLNIMGLLDEPTSGTVELCGTTISHNLSDNRVIPPSAIFWGLSRTITIFRRKLSWRRTAPRILRKRVISQHISASS